MHLDAKKKDEELKPSTTAEADLKKYVKCCVLSANRSLNSFSLTSFMTKEERGQVEDLIKQSCEKLDGDTAGK